MNIKDLIMYFLNENEVEQFGKWAFGDLYKELQGIQIVEAWNFIHNDELQLKRNGIPKEDVEKMIELWKSSLNVVQNSNS